LRRPHLEKPRPREAPSNLAIIGRYILTPGIFRELADTHAGAGGEIQLTDAIRLLIRSGRKVLGIRLTLEEPRFDIGNFESYFAAFAEFALGDPQYGPGLRSRLERLLERTGECRV